MGRWSVLATLACGYLLFTASGVWAAARGSSGAKVSSGAKPSSTSAAYRPTTAYNPNGAPTFASAPYYKPTTTSTPYKPAMGVPLAPSSFGSYAYKPPRSGFRPTSMIVPFAIGAFAGTAAHSMLRSNPNAYCNGRNIVCYKEACEAAKAQCTSGAAANQTLQLVPCPSSQFGECWETPEQTFSCYGARRPQMDGDVVSWCNFPDDGSGSGTGGTLQPLVSSAGESSLLPRGRQQSLQLVAAGLASWLLLGLIV